MAKTATAAVRMYKSSVGEIEANRQAIVALLNARLADSVDLRSQVKWAHWNVKGMHFIQLHALFGQGPLVPGSPFAVLVRLEKKFSKSGGVTSPDNRRFFAPETVACPPVQVHQRKPSGRS